MSGSHDPCAGHPCDHCWICTQLGVCCGQVPNIKTYLSPAAVSNTRIEEFKEAIKAQAPQLSMAELIRLDIQISLGDRHRIHEDHHHDHGGDHEHEHDRERFTVSFEHDIVVTEDEEQVAPPLQLPAGPQAMPQLTAGPDVPILLKIRADIKNKGRNTNG